MRNGGSKLLILPFFPDINKIDNRPIMSQKKQVNILHFISKITDKITNLVLCLSVQVLENSQLCVPTFPLCFTSFSLSHKKFISY